LLKEAKGENKTVEVSSELELPMLIKYRDPTIDGIEDEDEKFKADVASRPDESTLDDYSRTPVGDFGKALLRGMGWGEGVPIGLTNPKVVEPLEFAQRPGYRSGLGASLETHAPPKRKRRLKPGEKAEDFEAKVLAPNADGSARHTKSLDEKLIPISKLGLQKGSLVSIVSGKHDGLNAWVVQISGDDVIVRLESSGEEVGVQKSDVSIVNRQSLSQDHPALSFMEEEDKK